MVMGIKTLTKEAALFGHITKQQGTPVAHSDQSMSCFGNAPWKARNLVTHRHTNLPVEVCMGVSELQMYCMNIEGTNGEKMVEDTWKRKTRYRLFKNGTPREEDDDGNEEGGGRW